jgi:hypothetical protein
VTEWPERGPLARTWLRPAVTRPITLRNKQLARRFRLLAERRHAQAGMLASPGPAPPDRQARA